MYRRYQSKKAFSSADSSFFGRAPAFPEGRAPLFFEPGGGAFPVRLAVWPAIRTKNETGRHHPMPSPSQDDDRPEIPRMTRSAIRFSSGSFPESPYFRRASGAGPGFYHGREKDDVSSMSVYCHKTVSYARPMGRESTSGTTFYANEGFKAVTVHLPLKTHRKLQKIARKEDRSLQKTIRRILVDYADNVPPSRR